MAFLTLERDGAILTVTMNQPETRNALTGNTAVAEFVQLCADVRKDAGVKVVILTGAGPIFSSGGNVKDMKRFFDDALTPDLIREEYRQGIQQIPLALHELDVPVICAVNGPAIGAGLDLTCMCDIRICSETATFAESFVRVGIVPGDGGAWLLPRAVGMAKAAEMSFTGELVDAQAALAMGLVSRVVPHAALLAEANALAERIAANPGQALRMTKRLMREAQTSRLDSILELSAAYQALTHGSAEHDGAVAAFLDGRKG